MRRIVGRHRTVIARVLQWAICASLISLGRPGAAELKLAFEMQPPHLEKMTATRERPLFVPSRRPAPPSVPVIQTPEIPSAQRATPPDAVVTGIIMGPSTRMAFLKLPANKTVTLSEGGTLDAWTLLEIEPYQIVLARGDERTTLKLHSPTRDRTNQAPRTVH